MSHYPILGSSHLDVRFDGAPPRIHPLGLLVLRALDGRLAPLNAEIHAEYLGRSVPATIHDNVGTSGSLVASAPAFTMADWDRDGVREEQLLQLSDEEALRFFDPETEELQWSTDAKVIRFDWIQQGDADDGERPLWSFANAAATGALLKFIESGTGTVQLIHDNGTSAVVSELAVADGDCCSARCCYFDDGSVQLGLTKVGVSGGAEVLAAKSAALLPEAEWGNGSGVQFRLNEFDGTHGAMLFRHLGVYGGTATRRQLLEVL